MTFLWLFRTTQILKSSPLQNHLTVCSPSWLFISATWHLCEAISQRNLKNLRINQKEMLSRSYILVVKCYNSASTSLTGCVQDVQLLLQYWRCISKHLTSAINHYTMSCDNRNMEVSFITWKNIIQLLCLRWTWTLLFCRKIRTMLNKNISEFR